MVKQYLCCFELDTGVTLIGLLHLNAALWFFWRFTTLTPVYLWFDLMISAVFATRTGIYLHGCLRDDIFATVKSRERFHRVNWVSGIALVVVVILQIIVSWVDWGFFPYMSTIGWAMVGGLNVYHWIVLKSFANFEDQSEVGELTEGLQS